MTTKAKDRPTAAKSTSASRPVAKKAQASKPTATSGTVNKGGASPAKKAAAKRPSMIAPSAPAASRDHVLPDEMPVVTDAESLEFLKAIDAFKRRTGKPFPTWTQVLGVAKSLGYLRN